MSRGVGDRGREKGGGQGRALCIAGRQTQGRAEFLVLYVGDGVLVLVAGLRGGNLAEGEEPPIWLSWTWKLTDRWGEGASMLRTEGIHALVRSELRSPLIPSRRRATCAGRREGLARGGTREALRQVLPHFVQSY
jgi:hypothetical protein